MHRSESTTTTIFKNSLSWALSGAGLVRLRKLVPLGLKCLRENEQKTQVRVGFDIRLASWRRFARWQVGELARMGVLTQTLKPHLFCSACATTKQAAEKVVEAEKPVPRRLKPH